MSFCANCGTRIETKASFCEKCGAAVYVENEKQISRSPFEGKVWYRLLKVIYIVLFGIFVGGTLLMSYALIPTETYYDPNPDYGSWFFYSLLALFIVWGLLKLVRIGVLYIALGGKPAWKKEFKKFY
jgi:hypothetical protein